MASCTGIHTFQVGDSEYVGDQYSAGTTSSLLLSSFLFYLLFFVFLFFYYLFLFLVSFGFVLFLFTSMLGNVHAVVHLEDGTHMFRVQLIFIILPLVSSLLFLFTSFFSFLFSFFFLHIYLILTID